MITRRGIAPELVLRPKNTVNQRIVLLRGPKLRPDAGQAMQRTEFRLGYVFVIVPDQSGVPRRLVGHYGEGRQQKTKQPVLPPGRRRKSRHTPLLRPLAAARACPPGGRARRFGRFGGGPLFLPLHAD